MREVPKELWNEVLEIVTDIVWGPDQDDIQATSAKVGRLRALYTKQEALGLPEPFLTEALADYTDDAAEAVNLYRRALSQFSVYPEEPIHTKRICLASRLIELGDLAEARMELVLGRVEADRLNDTDYVTLADELLAQLVR